MVAAVPSLCCRDYTPSVLRFPKRLEDRLKVLFPRKAERDRFVLEVLEAALQTLPKEEGTSPAPRSGGTLHLFTDGGSRGNPGQAAVGCVLKDPFTHQTVATYQECIGVKTNNVAEYEALIAGLTLALKYHPDLLCCFLDSQLVVRQLRGEYRVRMASLQPLLDRIQELCSHFPSVTFETIPRQQNREADALVNLALDRITAKPPPPTHP